MEVWRATLRAFDAGTCTATVEVVGSRGFNLAGVPVSRGIAPAELVTGRLVYLVVQDPTNPTDAMVVGVW